MELEILLKAYRLMCSAKAMAETYESHRQICKYVHSTSRGHEAIQLATAFQLKPIDYVSPYYRDESLLLGLGYSPYQLMLQLLTKAGDPFSAGRSYYSHPANREADKPRIIHQSSATGMQAIPTTGIAQGIQYWENFPQPLRRRDLADAHASLREGPRYPGFSSGEVSQGVTPPAGEPERALVVCSLGDASVTEGEVAEAFQFAVLKQLPIIYLVQDNHWGISVTAEESRAMDAYDYAGGFIGMNRIRVDGTDFIPSYEVMQHVIADVREKRRPWLVHAKVSLLNHHTSGVRKEFYRSTEDLAKHFEDDPLRKLKNILLQKHVDENTLKKIEANEEQQIKNAFENALDSADPDPKEIMDFVFLPTPVTEEKGERYPARKEKVIMVDAALYAIRELMEEHTNIIFYGQDVGRRLGGVFREAATLAEKFGDHRVFNTAIQEAYIIGSTVGMSAVGLKPIVEVQFADYIHPAINQLVSEISKSCYLTHGKFPVGAIIRVPVGAYGGGGPYHSGCVETMLLSVKGIKIAYPSNAADMKGLMKAAYYDPNPVLMLEHKGLYWSKLPGTDEAKTVEPARDYILPFGKANVILTADKSRIANGESCCVITYGMGVYWAKAAAKNLPGQVEIVDLRTLFPLDEEMIFEAIKRHGKCLVITEEQQNNSFAEALAGRISQNCFKWLDAPVDVLGALNLPAVPLNIELERAMLPSPEKVTARLTQLFSF
ncbi:MAG TPA: thiamine pyrophosphate-dependent enzyme [Chitinophagaceae bacterium]|nr:thiamine pyrophosphate-dependent enzyme [Chitinophagaceae bacterium]